MRLSSAVVLWSGRDLRRRWLALVLIGVLAGLTAGVALAAFDGARRSGTAFERFRAVTNASDAVVFSSQTDALDPDWDKLRSRPEVGSVAVWALEFGDVAGQPDSPLFGPVGSTWLQSVDRPTVVAGRMFDPANPDEVVITDDAAHQFGLGLGGHFPFAPYGPDEKPGDPAILPTRDMTIVGVVRSPLSWTFTGGIFSSPALVRELTGKGLVLPNAFVQLRHGQADMAALRRDVGDDIAPGTPVLDLHTTARRVTATTDVERAMLLLLAAIVAVAGALLIGQALARSAAAIAADAPALRGLGMAKSELMLSAALPHVVTAGVAGAGTAATAIVASRWFPVGLAARVDPQRGIRVDGPLFALGSVAVAGLVVLAVTAFSWSAARPHLGEPAERVRWTTRLGLRRPLAAVIGTRYALAGGRGPNRSVGRSALVGAAAALAGVVAILTLDTGLATAQRHADLAGVSWDANVMPVPAKSGPDGVAPDLLAAVRSDPDVAAVTTVGRASLQVGDVGVPTFMVQPDGHGAGIELVTLEGRRPVAPGEVVLGPSTERDLGVKIGDDVTLAAGRTFRVVGTGLFPSDVHAQFDEGAWVVPDDWYGLARGQLGDGNSLLAVAVRFGHPDHADAKIAALAARVGDGAQAVGPVDVPEELINLHQVRSLPVVLATFLAFVGVAAVAYGLFSSVRRRRRDFAVLSALGVTRRGAGLIVAAQAVAVAAVGVVVGVPIGLVVGRSGWRAIAERVPLVFRSPVHPGTVLVVVPLALAGGLVLAAWPARRAARIRAAAVLRAE